VGGLVLEVCDVVALVPEAVHVLAVEGASRSV